MPVTSQAGEVTPWSSTTAAAREAQGHGGMTHDGEREARPFCGQVWHRVESIFRKEDQAQHGTACEHRESLAAGRREVKLLAKVHEARSEQRILSLSPRPRRAWVRGCLGARESRRHGIRRTSWPWPTSHSLARSRIPYYRVFLRHPVPSVFLQVCVDPGIAGTSRCWRPRAGKFREIWQWGVYRAEHRLQASLLALRDRFPHELACTDVDRSPLKSSWSQPCKLQKSAEWFLEDSLARRFWSSQADGEVKAVPRNKVLATPYPYSQW